MLVTPTSVMLGSAFLAFLSGLVASLVSPSPQARKLMARISVFFVLYGLPQTCVVGSLVYEMIERKQQSAKAQKNFSEALRENKHRREIKN